jgi:aminoglycoside phosphotransferase (APT) family kinase protein
MTSGAGASPAFAGAPEPDRLLEALRRGLGLSGEAALSLTEVGELSNINYVYRVETPDRILYLKVVPERAKRIPIPLPRERVFSEALALRRFRQLAGTDVIIPEVLFVDDQEKALAMTDVGEGRHVLFSVLPDRFELLSEQAVALGRALGAIHGGTRGDGPLRPPQEEFMLRKVIFDGLLGPGAKQLFPERWDGLNAEMQAHTQCLVHADLWSKNLLVRSGQPVALVDFEGVFYGDPAFDLGTLVAVSLVPALDRPGLVSSALDFVAGLLHSWSTACGSSEWARDVLPRTFHSVACFLAARGFGPFSYSISEPARQRLAGLARSLAEEPTEDLNTFRSRVELHAGSAPAA